MHRSHVKLLAGIDLHSVGQGSRLLESVPLDKESIPLGCVSFAA
jgi:hypothetical protein